MGGSDGAGARICRVRALLLYRGRRPCQKRYETTDIQVLDYPENIQRRPGMYVGGTGLDACTTWPTSSLTTPWTRRWQAPARMIQVEIHPDGALTVRDNGRGIPTGMHAEKGRPTLELVFTELHAGGKFKEGSYSTSGGLHGVGIKATNALSEWLEVSVRRNGVIYCQRHENGLPVTPSRSWSRACGSARSAMPARPRPSRSTPTRSWARARRHLQAQRPLYGHHRV
jgi:DNA gyrase/topoisomerase IV subunit B